MNIILITAALLFLAILLSSPYFWAWIRRDREDL